MSKRSTDLAYISGIFDIGGCIKIQTPFCALEPSLYVWLTTKSVEVVQFLQLFGAKVDPKVDGQFRAKWRDKAAYHILKDMLPNLKIRRDQAKVGIEFFEDKMKNGTLDRDKYQIRLKLAKNITS